MQCIVGVGVVLGLGLLLSAQALGNGRDSIRATNSDGGVRESTISPETEKGWLQ
jgi:hypothetical protein